MGDTWSKTKGGSSTSATAKNIAEGDGALVGELASFVAVGVDLIKDEIVWVEICKEQKTGVYPEETA